MGSRESAQSPDCETQIPDMLLVGWLLLKDLYVCLGSRAGSCVSGVCAVRSAVCACVCAPPPVLATRPLHECPDHQRVEQWWSFYGQGRGRHERQL